MKKTEEQKTAETIANKLDSVTLDLDQVGRYLATMPNVYYNRFMIVAEAAEFAKLEAESPLSVMNRFL
jgi:hypothetical protein